MALKGWQRANNHAVEPETRFATRMSKAQEYINSSDIRAKDGGGLDALAKSTHERCSRVSLLKEGGSAFGLEFRNQSIELPRTLYSL